VHKADMPPLVTTRTLAVDGTRLCLEGEPFHYQGLSFFNALYNPALNAGDESRRRWLETFSENGINALRVWCQWDFAPPRCFVDVARANTMYTEAGEVREGPFQVLVTLLEALDSLAMVAEVTLFSHEKQPNLPAPALEQATRRMAGWLRPYRNLILQLWNEDSTEVLRLVEAAKAVDPTRLVTNSPGFAGNLGDDAQNRALDLLTPHTARAGAERFWEVAPGQIAHLLEAYRKPVIDDEPARTGLLEHGGIPGGTQPGQHVEQIRRVRAVGGYHTYHHDMFQNGYGHPATPPSGLPEPNHSVFHRQVFDFLRQHREW
jgi:hypothetical protein